MPRRRLGVALLLPEPLAREVDGLRRACHDGALGRVPPHLTLVPPVNVREQDLPRALGILRDAASAASPMVLRLGPPATFLPATPTLHLAVEGSGPAVRALAALRDGVFRGPLERTLTFPFVPHVTLADGMDPDRIAAALVALSGFVVEATFDRVHLLQELRGEDGRRRWEPIADAALAPPIVVGRGGVELVLAVSRLLDPEAAALVAGDDAGSVDGPADRIPPGAEPIVVVARRRGEVVGVAHGWVRDDGAPLTGLVVERSQRRQGIARHLVAAFRHAAEQGAASG